MRRLLIAGMLAIGLFHLLPPAAEAQPRSWYWYWRRQPRRYRLYYASGYASRPYKRRANYYQIYAYNIPGKGFYYPKDYVYNYRGWYASRPYKVRANYYKLLPYNAPLGRGFYIPGDYRYNLRSYPYWYPLW